MAIQMTPDEERQILDHLRYHQQSRQTNAWLLAAIETFKELPAWLRVFLQATTIIGLLKVGAWIWGDVLVEAWALVLWAIGLIVGIVQQGDPAAWTVLGWLMGLCAVILLVARWVSTRWPDHSLPLDS